MNLQDQSSPSIFQCQLRVFSSWFHRWSNEERNFLLERLETIDPLFVEELYEKIRETNGIKWIFPVIYLMYGFLLLRLVWFLSHYYFFSYIFPFFYCWNHNMKRFSIKSLSSLYAAITNQMFLYFSITLSDIWFLQSINFVFLIKVCLTNFFKLWSIFFFIKLHSLIKHFRFHSLNLM